MIAFHPQTINFRRNSSPICSKYDDLMDVLKFHPVGGGASRKTSCLSAGCCGLLTLIRLTFLYH